MLPFNFNDNNDNSDNEEEFEGKIYCNCDECSEKETVKFVDSVLDLVKNAKTEDELRELLHDIAEYSKILGIKEYLHQVTIDASVTLYGLNEVTYTSNDDFDYQDFQDEEQVNNDIVDDNTSQRGYWNTDSIFGD